MERYEMAELLRDKAGVSYEEAKQALEACDWNMLEAMVILEQRGQVKSDEAPKARTDKKDEPNVLIRAITWLSGLVDKGNHSYFIIKKDQQEITRMPVTVFAVLLLLFHGLTIFALIMGLVFGYEYSFLGAKKVAEAKQAARQAETAAEELESRHTANSLGI